MKKNARIPFYGSDGVSLGFRELEAAKRLVANGQAVPVFGRKGHLKAIHLPHVDGSNPIREKPSTGTRYSYRQKLLGGRRCWSLHPVDFKDDTGAPVSMQPAFRQVLADCLSQGK